MRYQGKYRPSFPRKYRGDVRNIVYRSSWEYKFMKWCDVTPTVTEWGSEEIIIPYISPVDGKRHRYFPDFYVKVGKKKYIVEVKPFRQTLEPKTQKRVTKRYINEVVTFSVNQAKWKAAREFCKDNSLEFMLITEKELKV
ncbi:head closure [Synechococcus phage S-SSM4]|uniref:Head completion nuclease n=1 Tax=Synechococcus phage S-SSM4 TaxID=536466 RepID=M1TV19_9CAUD|nr:head closure [Synechococcus phage S-SSM4]AGG54279.1 head completion protein [Synechococcus phage S-SSM4]